MTYLEINGRKVGPGKPVYIVAEISANHNQSFDRAAELVRAAKDAGADAVKLQTYTPDTMTLRCDNEYFRIGAGTIWEGRTLHDLYAEAHMPWEWQPALKRIADGLGLDLFSTPFDGSAVEFLERMEVPAYKIASFEIVDMPLIRRVALTGKPLIVSTGMAAMPEIGEAVDTARASGAGQIALLRCASAYPAPPEALNLRAIPHLAAAFDVPVGLSDHTLGIAAAVASVALGASIIEKHFTRSRADAGPDSAFSLEPAEFKEMVEAVRTAEKAMGRATFGANGAQAASLPFRRSLFVVEDVKAGQPFTPFNVRSIRPGYGLHTRHLEEVLGSRAARDIPRGTPLRWDYVSRDSR